MIKWKEENDCDKETLSPCVVSAVRFDEVHVAVLGQESHQLFIGPEGRDSSCQSPTRQPAADLTSQKLTSHHTVNSD